MKLKILKLFSLTDKPEINAQLGLSETFNFCIYFCFILVFLNIKIWIYENFVAKATQHKNKCFWWRVWMPSPASSTPFGWVEISLRWLFCQQFGFKHIGELEITQGQYHTWLPCSYPFLAVLGDKILARADCWPDLVGMFLPRFVKDLLFGAAHLCFSPAWVHDIHLRHAYRLEDADFG